MVSNPVRIFMLLIIIPSCVIGVPLFVYREQWAAAVCYAVLGTYATVRAAQYNHNKPNQTTYERSSMTPQEVFDKVAAHLLTQRKQCKGTNPATGNIVCLYRGEGGLKCAAGCLIDDDTYERYNFKEKWNGARWSALPEQITRPIGNYVLVADLQLVHDSDANWESLRIKESLRFVAKKHNLDISVLDKYEDLYTSRSFPMRTILMSLLMIGVGAAQPMTAPTWRYESLYESIKRTGQPSMVANDNVEGPKHLFCRIPNVPPGFTGAIAAITVSL
jgi:hypothetical protein